MFRALARRWYVAVAAAVVVAGAGLPAIWLLIKPKYTATSAIEIAPVIPAIVFQDESGAMPFYSNYVSTQAQLIKSTRILYPVLEDPVVRKLPFIQQSRDALGDLQSGAGNDGRPQVAAAAGVGYGGGPEDGCGPGQRRCAGIHDGGGRERGDHRGRQSADARAGAGHGVGEASRAVRAGAAAGAGVRDDGPRCAGADNAYAAGDACRRSWGSIEGERLALRTQAQRIDEQEKAPPSPSELVVAQADYVSRDPIIMSLSAAIAALEQRLVEMNLSRNPDGTWLAAQQRILDAMKKRQEEVRIEAEGRFEG